MCAQRNYYRYLRLLAFCGALILGAGLWAGDAVSDDCSPQDEMKDDRIAAILNTLPCGEYEIKLSKPGSIYVGTLTVVDCLHDGRIEKSVYQTSGMEISIEEIEPSVLGEAPLSSVEIKPI